MIKNSIQSDSGSKHKAKPVRLGYRPETFLRLVHDPDSVIHVFVKDATVGSARRLVGYYDSHHLKKLAKDLQPYSGQATGIYYSLNPVNPSCLDRAPNCLKPVFKAASATKADITHRNLMLIDIDPVRSPGLSATDKEKEVAKSRARIIVRNLKKAGWPKPVVVDSGNGFHLLYRVDLPVDDRGLIHNCLRALADILDSEEVKIDTDVFDTPRIAKLPGTMACKGVSSADRPHRISGAFKLPEKLEIVDIQLLEELASLAPKLSVATSPRNPGLNCKPASSVPATTQVARARAYLQTMEPAVSGQHGRNQFLNAACRLVDDFALPAEQARPLLDEYNQRCVPPFNPGEVDDKLSSALAKVAERGGPSGLALNSLTKVNKAESSSKPASFVGYVPDLGLVWKPQVMMPVTKQVFNGFWVWYWLLWRSLRSDVHVPDVMLRQCHWGADYDKNWKARLEQKVGLRQVKKPNCTADTCCLHGSGQKHGHYKLDLENYGLLDAFCPAEMKQPGHLRNFDVFGESNQKLRVDAQKSGLLFNVYWPALVLGSSPRVGWTWSQQRLLVGIVHELTRTKHREGDDISAEVIQGNLVPSHCNSTQERVCPLLEPKQQYVAFAGNKNRKGRGYRLVGPTGKGWVYRAGYHKAPEMKTKKRVEAIRSFLTDLQKLTDDLGLIPAAFGQGKWKNLDEMHDCLQTGYGQDWLEACTMRIYTPADWRRRWRQFFSDKLGFDWIPAAPDDKGGDETEEETRDPDRIITATQVKRLLTQNKWTQQRLVDEIASVTGKKCSLRRVQRHLTGLSCTESFFEEVDQVRLEQQKATLEVTNGD